MAGLWLAGRWRPVKAATTRAERAVGLAWAPKPSAAECLVAILRLSERLPGAGGLDMSQPVLRAACRELEERRELHAQRIADARARVADMLGSGAWLAAIRASYDARVREHNNRIGTQPEGAGAHHGATAGEGR